MSPGPLLVVHALVTWSLCGLIWFVQLVHYPLFLRVPEAAAVAYEREHCRRITPLVAPLMLLEATLAAWLCWSPPAGVATATALAGAGLLLVVWSSTAFLQVALHRRLERADDRRSKLRLVHTNWLRTAAWTLRGALAAAMLL